MTILLVYFCPLLTNQQQQKIHPKFSYSPFEFFTTPFLTLVTMFMLLSHVLEIVQSSKSCLKALDPMIMLSIFKLGQ